MRIAMPSMPQSLAYSVVAATGVTFLIAVILLIYGDLVGGLLILTVAAAIYWLLGRNLVTIVTAGQVAASIALLCVVCALADLIVGFPYEAILFLLVAVALGFAFLLLHQGTVPIEVRFGRVIAVASPSRLIHLRMLEELREILRCRDGGVGDHGCILTEYQGRSS